MLANSDKIVNPENERSSIEQLADAISIELAKKLVRHYPGIELRLPLKIKHSSHHLIRNLGRDDAEALCKYAGEDTISVPRTMPFSLKFNHNIDRDDFIRQMVVDGLCRREMALHLGVSQRQVRRLISKLGLSGELGSRRCINKPNSLSRVSNAPLTGHGSETSAHHPRKNKRRSMAVCGVTRSTQGMTVQSTKEIAT